jgi:hypothetical protein
MTNPNIQIDDVVREMTDEEYEAYLAEVASAPVFPPVEVATVTKKSTK